MWKGSQYVIAMLRIKGSIPCVRDNSRTAVIPGTCVIAQLRIKGSISCGGIIHELLSFLVHVRLLY